MKLSIALLIIALLVVGCEEIAISQLKTQVLRNASNPKEIQQENASRGLHTNVRTDVTIPQEIQAQFKELQRELNVLTNNHPPIGPNHYLQLKERLEFFEKQAIIPREDIENAKQKLQQLIPREFTEQKQQVAEQQASAQATTSKPFELILPVLKENVIFEHGGMWPFGVRGGEHPLGHPGIDFEANEGTPVMASADGIVGFTGDSGHHDYKTISIFHENNFDTYYTGAMKDIKVKKGNRVSRGDVIAYYSKPEAGWPSIHLGLQRKVPDEAVCPVEYFSSQAKKEIEELFAKAFYNEMKEYPLLCNPCPEGGCR